MTERTARLHERLCRLFGDYGYGMIKREITAAGLVLLPSEPDEATVERVAKAIDAAVSTEPWNIDPGRRRRARVTAQARAAYRAATEESMGDGCDE